MKSAYELAMEKLGETDPVSSLTDDQRARIAAVEAKYRAKIAEREVFLGDLLSKAISGGDQQEAADLEQQLVREKQKFTSQCEEEKNKVHAESE